MGGGAREADGGGRACRASAFEPLENYIWPGIAARTASFPL